MVCSFTQHSYLNLQVHALRARPGSPLYGDVVKIVSKGERHNCQGAGNYKYYKVVYDGDTGYVAGDYLDCSSEAVPGPSMEDN